MLLSKSRAKLNELFPILDELTRQMAWKKEIVPKVIFVFNIAEDC
jgi:hypothetical protein